MGARRAKKLFGSASDYAGKGVFAGGSSGAGTDAGHGGDGAAAMICVTLAHEKILRKNFTNLPKICISFAEFGGDIADPCAGDLAVYGRIADEIEGKLLSIIEFLRKELDDH
jgi:hypothetical protein